ncbi:hypothetical protein L208DRAFT_471270 [Tricholoma matsutake]|nr:hypothetical protein L208DRAFT_471270 [Tricholoma matsutake 945]
MMWRSRKCCKIINGIILHLLETVTPHRVVTYEKEKKRKRSSSPSSSPRSPVTILVPILVPVIVIADAILVLVSLASFLRFLPPLSPPRCPLPWHTVQ